MTNNSRSRFDTKNKMGYSEKTTACLVVIVILAAIVFTSFHASHELVHGCDEESCPVCISLEMSKSLRQSGVVVTVAAVFVILIFLEKAAIISETEICPKTPVERKVRMNN